MKHHASQKSKKHYPMENINEYYGCITKVEDLWCIEEFGIHNKCVMESLHIFPGYYDRFTKHITPRYIYIMSNRKYSLEDFTRMTNLVKQDYKKPFDAAYCEISFGEKECGGVRIAGIDDYNEILNLQTAYYHHGLDLKKKQKKNEGLKAIIKIRKFFKLLLINETIFLDNHFRNIGYFKVARDIPWEEFEKIIPVVRSNWPGNSFDAAKSIIYQNSEITDLIRIYSHDLTAEFLMKLREIYLRYTE